MPGGAVRRMALVGGRCAGKRRRWGRGDGWRSIGVRGHRTVWLASGEIRVLLGWAALVEFPVCAPVGRDGFWWDRRPRRGLYRWRSRGELQAFEDPAGDGWVFDGGDQAQRRAAAGTTQGVDFEYAQRVKSNCCIESRHPTLATTSRIGVQTGLDAAKRIRRIRLLAVAVSARFRDLRNLEGVKDLHGFS